MTQISQNNEPENLFCTKGCDKRYMSYHNQTNDGLPLEQCPRMCTMERFMASLNLEHYHSSSPTPPQRASGTSDYCTCTGSASGTTGTHAQAWSECSSCHGDYNSESELSLSSDTAGLGSEEFSTLRLISSSSDEEESYFERLSRTLPDHSRMLRYKKVTAVVPSHNKNAYTPDEFTLNVIEDLFYTPELTERTSLQASQIVSVGPHGAKFYRDEPALIYLPLGAQIDDPDHIVCLSSDTPEGEIPDWKPLPKFHYQYIPRENKIMIRAWHFSLYTAIVSCPYPETTRTVKNKENTTIEVEKVEGVKLNFEEGTLPKDFEATIKVFYSDDPVLREQSENDNVKALATPIVQLGPHGVKFSKPVKIQLPLPDCDKIMRQFRLDPQTDLKLYCSQNSDDKHMNWQLIETPIEVRQDSKLNYYITFYVKHFSWYKGLWDILAQTTHAAKVGVSYFYPYIRFSMMCTAMMDETADTKSFGLEIICYRSDKKLPEIGNYKHRVGGSTKPKFVRPGAIKVRLVSQAFEADTQHGENAELCKEEPDFHGLEFEKQFACVYTAEPVKKGNIGKCLVERQGAGFIENIFEFNLTKYGNEGEFMMDSTDGWSLIATRELASMLNITTDENWKLFAKHLGFTKHEINTKLTCTTDPFAVMMSAFQTRGGSPNEFVQALYAVGRDLKLCNEAPPSQFNYANTSGFRSTSEDDSEDTSPGLSRASTPNRKRRMLPGFPGHSFNKRKRSDQSESAASSYSSHTDVIHRANKQPLDTPDLWKISQFINNHWKSLGRTLSVPEEDLKQVEHAHQEMRECSYQMLLKWKERFPLKCTFGCLYIALCDSGLNSVATAHCVISKSPK